LPGRGLVSAAALIAIALACLTVTRKLERERRLLRKLRKRGAVEPGWALPLDELTDDERDAAASLADSGVLEIRKQSVPAGDSLASRSVGGVRGQRVPAGGSLADRSVADRSAVFIRTAELGGFRQKRLRLLVMGGFGALLLAVVVALLILRR
jgi:hypothetical protein